MKTGYLIIVLLFIATGCAKTNQQKIATTSKESTNGTVAGRACRTYEVFLEQLKADPTLKSRMDAIEAYTARYVQNPAAFRKTADGILEVPVVVNVLYNLPQENISG